MARSDQSVSAVVALPAQYKDLPGRRLEAQRNLLTNNFGHGGSRIFHQLSAADAVAFGREPIHFAHFGCGESFHNGRFTGKIKASSRR